MKLHRIGTAVCATALLFGPTFARDGVERLEEFEGKYRGSGVMTFESQGLGGGPATGALRASSKTSKGVLRFEGVFAGNGGEIAVRRTLRIRTASRFRSVTRLIEGGPNIPGKGHGRYRALRNRLSYRDRPVFDDAGTPNIFRILGSARFGPHTMIVRESWTSLESGNEFAFTYLLKRRR
jgi:hypothetical protein